MNASRRLLTAAAVMALTSAGVQADSGEHGSDGAHHSPHAVGVFMGYADPGGEPAEVTWGLEYEYRPGNRFGAGLIAERTREAHHGDGATVGLAAGHVHAGGLRLSAGIGKEWIGGHGSHWLQRLGMSYDIEVGGVAIAPTIAVDFVDGERVAVYGLALIKHL